MHKLFVRDDHPFPSIKKECKEKVSDGHIIFGVRRARLKVISEESVGWTKAILIDNLA